MRKPTVPSKLGDILIECVISRNSSYSATVPRYPVEDGTFVSDTVLKNPMTMTLVVMVTDHPLTWGSYMVGSSSRVADVRKSLLEKYFNGEVFTLTTPDNVYDNMVIRGIRFPEDRYRNGMEVTIDLMQVNITTVKTSASGSYQYSGTSGSSSGTTNTDAVNSSTGGSVWTKIMNFITNG